VYVWLLLLDNIYTIAGKSCAYGLHILYVNILEFELNVHFIYLSTRFQQSNLSVESVTGYEIN
jgi:hypothetical protein